MFTLPNFLKKNLGGFRHFDDFYKNKFKYQLIIVSPQNKAIKVPVTRKGPNGTSLLSAFFLKTINPIPIIAPMKKAKKRAIKILGKPRKSPIKKANFGSPNPIHLPREIKTIARKKEATITAENITFSISYFV